jgi:molecular chaperone IbpA
MQLRTIDANALANLNRALIGFDHVFNAIENRWANQVNNNYPPFNIIKHSDNDYEIEIAVAGFSKTEITVEVDQDQLIVKGEKQIGEDATAPEYLHRGLAARNFARSFTLAEHMEVRGAEVVDGMLRVSLQRIVPEALKPRQIEVK